MTVSSTLFGLFLPQPRAAALLLLPAILGAPAHGPGPLKLFPAGPPTPSPVGPGMPGTSGPITPGPFGPATPRPMGPITPGSPMGPLTGANAGPNLESWRYWWEFNRDRFLDLRTKVAAIDGVQTPRTADDLLASGAVRKNLQPTIEELASHALPALFEAAENGSSPFLRIASLRALARIGAESTRTLDVLVRGLADKEVSVAEAAALGIGILGIPESLHPLRALLEDEIEGRKLVGGRSEVPWRVRALAAYSVGLTGERVVNPHYRARAQEMLLQLLSKETARRSAHRDIKVAAIVALGLIPDLEYKAALGLQKYLSENSEREDLVCAHIPPAIAGLLKNAPPPERGRFVAEILDHLEKPQKKAKRLLRAGYAIALGQLVRSGDAFEPQAIAALRAMSEGDSAKGPEAGLLALISLGEICGTGAPGGDVEKLLLERASARSGRVASRAWAALALGIAGFDQRARAASLSEDKDFIAKILLERIPEIRDPEQAAGFCVALGLRSHKSAASTLLRQLSEIRDEEYRGYVTIGLGLVQDSQATGPLKKALEESKRKQWMLYHSAVGLALLGDKSAISQLLQLLADPDNDGSLVQGAVADALGVIGDYRTLPALGALLKDTKKSASCRASAATALGIVGDPAPVPWHARITSQFNYAASVETVNDFIWGY